MPRRDSGVQLAASYQLLASYLLGDVEDLLEGEEELGPARRRIGRLMEILTSASRAAELPYPAPPEERRTGQARAERSRILASRESDQELLQLVSSAHGEEPEATARWAEASSARLTSLEEGAWQDPSAEETSFVEDELRPFLRRLQRIEEADARRYGRLGGTTRR